MLDFDPAREPAPPRDAATLVVVRDAGGQLEVFFVERHKKSAFLGGALVFPGGKLDPEDRDDGWSELVTPPHPASFADDSTMLRALAITACREALEEAAILPIRVNPSPGIAGAPAGLPAHDDLLALREGIRTKFRTLRGFLRERGLMLDLAALRPLARWITPAAEGRRFDTRFFITALGPGQRGFHDQRETTASLWATPSSVLARFAEGTIELLPPTHRTVELLSQVGSADEALSLTDHACLDPICPRLVLQDDTIALALPGDPEHETRTPRVAGSSRFVLRGTRWLPENAPPQRPSR